MPDQAQPLKITLLIVVRNAAGPLVELLGGVSRQDYASDGFDVVLVDGNSEDGTRAVCEQFKATANHLSVRIIDNPRKSLPAGWNLGLGAGTGDAIVRLDAHARIPPDFLRRNVECLLGGHAICGGYCESGRRTGTEGLLAYLAERSRFGGGAAPFRNPGAGRFVDSVAYGAYRRIVFEQVGGLDERLVRNQDNELHYRIKRAGFKFFYSPSIHSFHSVRPSVAALLRQKFLNGLWVGLVGSGIQLRAFALRHWAPFAFVARIGGIAMLCSFEGIRSGCLVALWLLATGYGFCAMVFAWCAVRAEHSRPWRLVPGLLCAFLAMHLAYGIGTLCGLLQMPWFVWKTRGYQKVWPVGSARTPK